MKKLIKGLISLAIIAAIVFGVYKVFFDCEKYVSHFDTTFTLEKMDYASLDEEAIVKLMGIDDNRCNGDDCEKEGEIVAKVLVINDHHFSYVKLGSLAESKVYLEDLDYTIELIEASNDKVKLKLLKNDE